MKNLLHFTDHLIPYDTFLNDIASRVVCMMKMDADDPDFVSQRKAFEMFGRRNVERWKRMGMVQPFKRPGKVEYCTAELRMLQRQTQDYFSNSPNKQPL